MESRQKFYTVFSLRLAGYLMMHGFVLMDMREHIDGSGKKVFYFMKSPELEKLIGEYTKISKWRIFKQTLEDD